MSGEQCVMMSGTQQMQLWCAGSWTTPEVNLVLVPNIPFIDISVALFNWKTRPKSILVRNIDKECFILVIKTKIKIMTVYYLKNTEIPQILKGWLKKQKVLLLTLVKFSKTKLKLIATST